MMKKLVTALVLLLLALSVAACTKGEAKNGEKKIVFFTNRTDKAQTTIRELADEFEAANPGVTVEIESVESSQLQTVLGTRASANQMPDVTIVLNEWDKKDYPDFFLPIGDLFSKDDIYLYDDGVVDGKLYRVTSAINIAGFIYNKDAFRKAGVESAPKTWDEYYAVCEKLKSAGIVPYGTNYKDIWPLEKIAMDMANLVEGDPNYLNSIAEPGTPMLKQGSGLLTAWNHVRTMYEKGYVEKDIMSTNWDNFKVQMAKGDIAMTFLATWFPPQVIENGLEADKVGMFPVPGSDTLIITPDWRLAVSKDSKHPETSKKFLKFLFDDQRYAKAVGVISPLKGIKYDAPHIDEIFSYNLEVKQAVSETMQYKKVYSSAQINYGSALQEFMVADDKSEVIENFNKRWEGVK